MARFHWNTVNMIGWWWMCDAAVCVSACSTSSTTMDTSASRSQCSASAFSTSWWGVILLSPSLLFYAQFAVLNRFPRAECMCWYFYIMFIWFCKTRSENETRNSMQQIRNRFTRVKPVNAGYTLCLIKNTPDIFSCNLNKHFLISIIFSSNIT